MILTDFTFYVHPVSFTEFIFDTKKPHPPNEPASLIKICYDQTWMIKKYNIIRKTDLTLDECITEIYSFEIQHQWCACVLFVS